MAESNAFTKGVSQTAFVGENALGFMFDITGKTIGTAALIGVWGAIGLFVGESVGGLVGFGENTAEALISGSSVSDAYEHGIKESLMYGTITGKVGAASGCLLGLLTALELLWRR